MVAPLVSPHRGSHGPRRNTHRPTGFDENNGQAGARRFAEGLGFLQALIGALASGVVVNVDQLEELTIQGLGRFAGRMSVLHKVPRQGQQLGAPWVTRFVENRVRQNVIQKHRLGHLGGPGEFLSGPEGQIKILQQELVAEIRSVALGHVFGQKTGRILTGSSVPILSRSDKVWDRGRPGRPPECNEHGHETNHTHGFTLHQLSSPGQSTSTDASHRQTGVPINRTSLERFNGIHRAGSGLFWRETQKFLLV